MPRAGTIHPAPPPSPPPPPALRPIPRRDPAVRAIAASWRAQTGGSDQPDSPGRRTLVACSGGGDSSGLILALAAAAPALVVVAHIVHDLRPPAEALADRDAAAALAAALNLSFLEARISVRPEGKNAEAAARRLRYAALAELAGQARCPFVATAHHAGDQLETILMGLLRGAGPRGLSGVAPKRRLRDSNIAIIRPCLTVARADLQRLCADAGWTWREDATNSDRSRLRAALRHTIIPDLERLRPGASRRAARSAAILADAAGLIAQHAEALLARAERGDSSITWDRGLLRGERPVVLGALLKAAAHSLAGARGQDRLGSKHLTPAVRAIRDGSTERRLFRFPGLALTVTTRTVKLQKVPNA